MSKKRKRKKEQLQLINPNVAGIDIGNSAHYVAVPSHLETPNVRTFGTFTSDLESLGDWLVSLGIESVAMESTGIYWLGIFEVLERKGLQVVLVNAHHLKNVPGRKSDVRDCQWIQQLHSYGLLSASFIPDEATRELRYFVRQRTSLQKEKSTKLQHMGKSLQLMNLKLQNVISSIEGKVGMQVIRAIADGETKATRLAKFYSKRMKGTKEEFKASLEGNYRREHVFALRQCLAHYDFLKSQMMECEREIEKILHLWEHGEVVKDQENFTGKPKSRKANRNEYSFDAGNYLKSILGVDLTAIKGISELTIIEVISETGIDFSRWKTAKHFTSWLGLAPCPKITGGKVIGHSKAKDKSRAHQAFKLAAWSLHHSTCNLGALYRRLSIKKGSPIAIHAVARKLAVIFYTMVKNKVEYKPTTAKEYEEKRKANKLKMLEKEAKKINLVLQKNTA
jgi:transposase